MVCAGVRWCNEPDAADSASVTSRFGGTSRMQCSKDSTIADSSSSESISDTSRSAVARKRVKVAPSLSIKGVFVHGGVRWCALVYGGVQWCKVLSFCMWVYDSCKVTMAPFRSLSTTAL